MLINLKRTVNSEEFLINSQIRKKGVRLITDHKITKDSDKVVFTATQIYAFSSFDGTSTLSHKTTIRELLETFDKLDLETRLGIIQK